MEYSDFINVIEKVDGKYRLDVSYGGFRGRYQLRVVSYVQEAWGQRNLSASVDLREINNEEDVQKAIAPLLKRVDDRLAESVSRQAKLNESIAEREAQEKDMIRKIRVAAGGDPEKPIRLRILDMPRIKSNPLERVVDQIVRIREGVFLPEDREARAKALIDLDNLLGDFFDKLNS